MKPQNKHCEKCTTILSYGDEPPLCYVCRYGKERTAGYIRTIVWGCAG